MVEPQIVILVVAGSSPVGHPARGKSNPEPAPAPRLSGYAGLSLSF